jgi:hypothetical protein
MDKRWDKPELIVLVKGRPEEVALQAATSCKGLPGSDPANSKQSGCYRAENKCIPCEVMGGS